MTLLVLLAGGALHAATPDPAYLGQQEVQEAVVGQVPGLSACLESVPAISATFLVDARVGMAGSLEDLQLVLERGEGSVATCLEARMAEWHLRPHAEPDLALRFHLGILGGKVLSPVDLTLVRPDPEWPFLFLPPAIGAELRSAIRASLRDAGGVETPGGQ